MARQLLSRPWTHADDADLSRLWDSGLTGRSIALKLRRARHSVYTRARQLRLQKRPRFNGVAAIQRAKSGSQAGSQLPH
jgi:hypothetical protein